MKKSSIYKKLKKQSRERIRIRQIAREKRGSDIKTRNEKRFAALNQTYLTSNKYGGKTRIHIGFVPKTLFFLIVLFLYPFIFFELTIESFIFFMLFEVGFLILLFIPRVKISPRGIKYRNKNFKWEQIKTIGIGARRNGMPREFCHKFIYISKKTHEKPLQLINGSQSKETQFFGCDRGLAIPKFMILASFNRRLLLHIIAYWGIDIRNIENVKGWKSYVRFYSFFHRNKKSKYS